MAETFGKYCTALMGQYDNQMKPLVEESTRIIFELIMKNPSLQVRQSKNGRIEKGKFYVVQYNYNGNKLWCPIFVIDDRYSPELQKRIIYAMNLDYLPFRYKIIFFDKLWKMFKDIIDKNNVNNGNGLNVNEERAMKINFESVYKTLRDNGNFNYCITAYDYTKFVGMDMGQPKIYAVSTTIIPRLIFIDSKIINRKEMERAMKDSDVDRERAKLAEHLKAYEKTANDYSNDVKEYYEQLRLLENQYKIYENQS